MGNTPPDKIRFYYQYQSFVFKDRQRLKSFLIGLFRSEGLKLNSLNYIFCSDAFLLKLNQQHLNHDTFTDIITFELSDPEAPIEAEIYISVERVKENAETFLTSFRNELHRVIFHGALHLCGYKDKSKADQQLMRRRETYYLNKYFVSRET